MKKISIGLICCLVMLICCSCSKQNQEAFDFDEDNLLKLSEQYAEEMSSGDFKNVSDNFSDTVKKQLSEEAIKKAYNEVVSSIGTYKGILNKEISVKNNLATVNVLLEYESKNLIISFVFNTDNKVDGLWLNYAK